MTRSNISSLSSLSLLQTSQQSAGTRLFNANEMSENELVIVTGGAKGITAGNQSINQSIISPPSFILSSIVDLYIIPLSCSYRMRVGICKMLSQIEDDSCWFFQVWIHFVLVISIYLSSYLSILLVLSLTK